MAEPIATPLRMPEAAVMPPTPPVLSPPSPLRSQMNRPQLPRRQSRFTEDMTGEHTPAPSVYEPSSPLEQEAAPSMVSARSRGAPGLGPGSTYTYTPSAAPSREYRPVELIARGMNGCLHGAACVILIAIMVEFLAQWDGFWFEQISAQAVALLVFLGVDTLLDIVSLVRLHKEWAFWALLLRFVTAVVYLTLFVVYAAHGRVFPSGYTFWAMSPTFSGPVVYVFLWLLGVWNLCHVTLRRHRLGNGLRACLRTAGAASPSQPTSPGSSHSPRWRRWIGTSHHYSQTGDHDIEIHPHFRPQAMSTNSVVPSPAISLHDRPPVAELKRPSYTATTSTASTHSCVKAEERSIALKEEGPAERVHKEEKI